MRPWQKKFSASVLERGYQYYEQERLSQIETLEGITTCLASGKKTYRVEVKYANGHLSYATCSCPYAQNGHHCKHEAALLYALDARASKALPKARREFVDDYVAVDLLTTGLDVSQDEIVMLSAIRHYANGKVETFESLLHSERPLDHRLHLLYGISAEMVQKAPPPRRVLRDFQRFIQGATIIAHQWLEQFAFLQQAYIQVKLDAYEPYYMDTYVLAKRYLPTLHHYELEQVARYLCLDKAATSRALMVYGIYGCFKEMDAFFRLCRQIENDRIQP